MEAGGAGSSLGGRKKVRRGEEGKEKKRKDLKKKKKTKQTRTPRSHAPNYLLALDSDKPGAAQTQAAGPGGHGPPHSSFVSFFSPCPVSEFLLVFFRLFFRALQGTKKQFRSGRRERGRPPPPPGAAARAAPRRLSAGAPLQRFGKAKSRGSRKINNALFYLFTFSSSAQTFSSREGGGFERTNSCLKSNIDK